MKKYLLLFLLLNFGFAYSFENITIPNAGSNYSGNKIEQSVISNEEFVVLENKIFKKTFPADTAKNRLARLEKEIFGMEQKGSDEDRFENLITAADYYQSGYRQSKSLAEAKDAARLKQEEYKITPKDYITNYNFDNNTYNDYFPESSVRKTPYYYEEEDFMVPNEGKKQSKIKQFFSGIVDAIASGVVTGYTLPIDSFGYNPTIIIDDFTTFGNSNFTGIPPIQTYIPKINNYINPYRYSRQRPSYFARQNSYYPPPPPPRYYHSQKPYYNGVKNYKSGAGVNIIY